MHVNWNNGNVKVSIREWSGVGRPEYSHVYTFTTAGSLEAFIKELQDLLKLFKEDEISKKAKQLKEKEAKLAELKEQAARLEKELAAYKEGSLV